MSEHIPAVPQVPQPDTERIASAMDAARTAQDQADLAARQAGQNAQRNAVTRNEFLLNPNVQNAVVESVIAPMAAEIFASANRDTTVDPNQEGMKRLAAVVNLAPADVKALEQKIEATINLHATTGQPSSAADIAKALNPEENWFYSNFMHAHPGSPATKLDKRLQAMQDSGAIPGMNEAQWDVLNNSIDYTSGLTGVLQTVNNNVNRKLTIVANNTELLAQDPATLTPADQKKLESLIRSADINAEDFKAMQKAARTEIRRTQGADVTPELTNARTQEHVDKLRERLLKANQAGDTVQVDDLQKEIQRVLVDNVAARKRAQGVGDMHDTAGIDARHQKQIATLKQNLENANNRGDTLLAADLQAQLTAAEDRHQSVRYQHVDALRNSLTISQLRRLSGGEAARTQYDPNAVDPNNPPTVPGGPTNPNSSPVTQEMWDEAHTANDRITELRSGRGAQGDILSAARDGYVKVSAEQRNGHIGRIEGTGFRRFMRTFMNGISGNESQILDARVLAERKKHMRAFNDLANNVREEAQIVGESPSNIRTMMIDFAASDLFDLESGIDVERANRGNANWVARTWARRGRGVKGAIVAFPAAAAGAALGVTMGILGAPAILMVGAGAGVGYAFRKFGQRIARQASQGTLAVDQQNGFANARVRSQQTANNYRTAAAAAPATAGILDHSATVEANTRSQVHENQRRRGIASTVGSVAAGLAFAGGAFAGNAIASANAAPTTPAPNGNEGGSSAGTPPATGAETAPTVTPPNVDVNQYPWTVAHGMTPGHELTTIHHAMDTINQASNGATNLHLVNTHGNILEVYNGTHALSAAQQAQFNTAMLLS